MSSVSKYDLYFAHNHILSWIKTLGPFQYFHDATALFYFSQQGLYVSQKEKKENNLEIRACFWRDSFQAYQVQTSMTCLVNIKELIGLLKKAHSQQLTFVCGIETGQWTPFFRFVNLSQESITVTYELKDSWLVIPQEQSQKLEAYRLLSPFDPTWWDRNKNKNDSPQKPSCEIELCSYTFFQDLKRKPIAHDQWVLFCVDLESKQFSMCSENAMARSSCLYPVVVLKQNGLSSSANLRVPLKPLFLALHPLEQSHDFFVLSFASIDSQQSRLALEISSDLSKEQRIHWSLSLDLPLL